VIEVFPLRDESDYKKALSLLEHTPPGDADVESKIEIMAQLVELWERTHFAELPQPSAADALKELMLLKKTTQTELANLLGTPPSNISAVLTGRRKLNTAQVEKIAEFFEVEPSIFGEVLKARLRLSRKKRLELQSHSSSDESINVP
jgi:antitoxin component HigA of HigAB toxin-antitoxin module